MPNPAALFNANLRWDAFLHAFDVADDADHLAAGVQRVEGVQGDVQRVGVDGAEAFVEEERVDRGLVAEQIRQRQADQEIFASGERALAIRSGVGADEIRTTKPIEPVSSSFLLPSRLWHSMPI